MPESTLESKRVSTLGAIDHTVTAHRRRNLAIPSAKRCAGRIATTPKGRVPRAILILAVPMVLEMMMESVFAVCDVFFVGKLGAGAVATVGLTESWLTIMYALAMGLAIAASAMVARRTGERDREGAAHAAGQGILLAIAMAVVLGVAGALLAPRLLGVMGASSGRDRDGQLVHASHARRKRHHHHAVRDQRDLPRCRRRRHRHARVVVGECNQHSARSVFDLWLGTVPEARRDRRGGRDDHRSRNGRAVRAQPTAQAWFANRHPSASSSSRPAADWTTDSHRMVGRGPDADRYVQLDRPHTHSLNLRQQRVGWVHDRHPTDHFRPTASRGRGQCGSDYGWSGVRCKKAGPCGARREGGWHVQHDRTQRRRRACSRSSPRRLLTCSRRIRWWYRSRRMRFASSRADFRSMHGEW